MEPIKIDQEDIKKAIKNGNSYIQVDNRKFLLFEVEEVNNNDCYVVSDATEEKALLDALNKENPILSSEEINKMLGK